MMKFNAMDGGRFAFVPDDPVLFTVVDVETVIPVVFVLIAPGVYPVRLDPPALFC